MALKRYEWPKEEEKPMVKRKEVKYEYHELCVTWRTLQNSKNAVTTYEELVADIKKNGLINPIWLYEGKILDGRNRYMACKELGIPIKTQEYTGDDPQGFVHSLNDKRRHQTKDERIEQALKERQIIDERTGKPKYTFEELAEKHNVSVSTLKRATPAKHSPSKKQRFNEPFDDVQPIDYSKIVPKDSELENVSSVHSIDVKTMTEQDKKDTEEVNKEVKEFHKKQGLEILREFVKKFSDVDEFIDIIKTIKNYDHKKES